ncbi:MAG: SMC-Scp complex subunit ScpB [Bacillota bacterium]
MAEKGPEAIEALLFAAAEPLPLEEMARILEVTEMETLVYITELRSSLSKTRGIGIQEVAGGYQLTTKPEFGVFVERLGRPKPPPPLSQAALETLAIIIYRQPVTRAEIESIRGVRCETALQTLEERGLIEETGRKDAIGRPILYGVTSRCLHYFGLRSAEDLPELEAEASEMEREEKTGTGQSDVN